MRCYCASTRQVARLLTRYYEERLRPANMTPAQFELLGTLMGSGGLAQAPLAEALRVDQTTLSRNLKPLMGRGWIASEIVAGNRRQKMYSVTTEGRGAWNLALPLWKIAQDGVRKSLGDASEDLWPVLDRLNEVMAADEHR